MDSKIREAFAWIEEWFRQNNEGGGRHHCPWCYYSHDDGIHADGADWKDIEHDPECVVGKALALLAAEPEPCFDSEQKQGTYDNPIDQDGSNQWVEHVICEGSREHVLWWDTHGGEHCSEPRCIINKPAEPEPCEDERAFAKSIYMDVCERVEKDGYVAAGFIETYAEEIAAYASQVADKRAEELLAQMKTLRAALEGLLDSENDTDESYKVAYEALAATESKH